MVTARWPSCEAPKSEAVARCACAGPGGNRPTGRRCSSPAAGGLIAGTSVRIVDPHSLPGCPPDRIGEIWVSGPSVACRLLETAGRNRQSYFRAKSRRNGERSYLRTGDLGYLRDGELYVTGRLKDLIILDGANYHPHESRPPSKDAMLRFAGCAAAFGVTADGVSVW